MTVIIKENDCTGCGECIPECPTEALSLNENKIAIVNDGECTDCEVCVSACPTEAIEMKV
jgi:Na+-translocating ferredoxin:NAD+ oxidoreductase RNF subunit RnfB